MGEFLVFCNSCVMGAAAYTGVQVGRLQRALATEARALEEAGDAGDAEVEDADVDADADALAAEMLRAVDAAEAEAEAEEATVAAQMPSRPLVGYFF